MAGLKWAGQPDACTVSHEMFDLSMVGRILLLSGLDNQCH